MNKEEKLAYFKKLRGVYFSLKGTRDKIFRDRNNLSKEQTKLKNMSTFTEEYLNDLILALEMDIDNLKIQVNMWNSLDSISDYTEEEESE